MRGIPRLLTVTALATIFLANVPIVMAADLTISAPGYITSANVTAVTISGAADSGATVEVTVADSNPAHDIVDTATAGGGNTWTMTKDLSGLDEGAITFSAECTAGCTGTTSDSQPAFKDTVAAVTIIDYPSPIVPSGAPFSVSGTADLGSSVALTISDGTPAHDVTGNTTAPAGTWTFSSLDLSGLDNGTNNILIHVAVTDPQSNTISDQRTVSKSWTPAKPAAPTTAHHDTYVTVTWVAPDNGGATISEFDVTTYIGATLQAQNCKGTGASATHCDVTGLTNGTAYTFKVAAKNANGSGPASDASDATTPSTVPAKPAKPTPVHGNGKVTVHWVAPNDGGAAISEYDVTTYLSGVLQAEACTGTGSDTSCDVSGLVNGTTYTFKVLAKNLNGSSTISDASDPSTPSTVPDKMAKPTGVHGNTSVTVHWVAPGGTGGASITGYTVTTYQGGVLQAQTCSGTSSDTSCVVTGLTNGTAYTFKVTAENLNGSSIVSDPSDPVTPSTVPSQMAAPTTTHGNLKMTVHWVAPADGGDAITGYTVTTYIGGVLQAQTCTGTGSDTSCDVTGLTNGTAYTFKVVATNTNGSSTISSASGADTPSTLPSTPAKPTTSRGNTQVTVHWVAPANGGAAIDQYYVSTYQGAVLQAQYCEGTGSDTSCVVTGLTNDVMYTFTVKAHNLNGWTAESPASDAINPHAGPSRPFPPTIGTATAGKISATVTWTAPGDDGGDAITSYTVTSVEDASKHCTTADGSTLTCVVRGLAAGTPYTFRVVATNGQGNSDPSAASSPAVSPTAGSVPAAPTSPTGVGLDQSARISWTLPTDDGGYDIDYYVVTSSSGKTCNATGAAATSCTFTKGLLTNGTIYTFTVKAHNTLGLSVASASTSSIKSRMGDTYMPLVPSRVLSATPIAASTTGSIVPLTFPVTGRTPGDATTNVPADAVAVTGVLSVSSPTTLGYFSLTPTPPAAIPSTSTLNFPAGDSRATGVTVPLSDLTSGVRYLSVTYVATSGSAQVKFDVSGYFVEGTGGANYFSLTPSRILDTRNGTGAPKAKLATNTPISFQVTGRGGVPSYATAITGNVTLTNQSATGSVTVGPVSETSPATATIFSPANVPGSADNRATGVTLKVDATGKLYATWVGPGGSTADLIFDVNGYFYKSNAGAMYVPLTPNRILDTRTKLGGLTHLASSSSKSFKVVNRATSDATKNVPSGAVAVTGILTVTRQQMLGYFTLSPVNSNNPTTSTLNFLLDNRATGVTVPLTSSGYLYIVYKAGSGKTADAIFDVSGYFVI